MLIENMNWSQQHLFVLLMSVNTHYKYDGMVDYAVLTLLNATTKNRLLNLSLAMVSKLLNITLWGYKPLYLYGQTWARRLGLSRDRFRA